MDQYVFRVFARTKSFINGIIPLFSTFYYPGNFAKTIFFNNFRFFQKLLVGVKQCFSVEVSLYQIQCFVQDGTFVAESIPSSV